MDDKVMHLLVKSIQYQYSTELTVVKIYFDEKEINNDPRMNKPIEYFKKHGKEHTCYHFKYSGTKDEILNNFNIADAYLAYNGPEKEDYIPDEKLKYVIYPRMKELLIKEGYIFKDPTFKNEEF